MTHPLTPPTRQRGKTYQRLPFGAIDGWAPLSADYADLVTQVQGLNKRVARELPTAEPGFHADFATFVGKWCEDNLRPLESVPDFEEWLQGTDYAETRKQELREWHERCKGRLPSRRYSSRINSFIKREVYGEVKAARWIMSRHDAFKAYSGRFFHAIEEAVFKLPQFVKHMTPSERVQAIMGLEHSGSFYYENDYKAFESHLIPALMSVCECQVYKYLLAKYPDHADNLCKTLCGRNNLRTRAKVKAAVEGRRMSGDMCTSVGNGLTNLLVVSYIVQHKCGDYRGLRALVEGDDGLFASPVELSAADFEKCGMTVEIASIDRPYQGHFCGCRLAIDGTVLRDPNKVFSAFGWSHSCIGHGEAVGMELLRAKALSLAYESPQCPIIGALARAGLAATEGYRPRWDDRWKTKVLGEMPLGVFKPSDAAREEFERRYGVSPGAQIAVERLIAVGRLGDVRHVMAPPCDLEWYSSRYVEVAG